ncbi:MAG TPA: HigA family addiction module antitoxin [Candidatus Desulfobacillus denitrificans]|nr:HigA family addiction module antitoxin [Candidatus Desulfobacillus denitrificans]HNT61584.1 HigA family addiction module antitoxin [Candidatus Desulfobacillus denitrificans]
MAHHLSLRRRGCRRCGPGGLSLMKTLRNPNRRPTHPGAILREDVLPALAMTQTEFAERLGVSRLSVSELLHGKRAMTPEMAARVARLLNTTPESWLRMQEAVDLWEVRQHPEKLAGIKPIRAERQAA